MQSFRLEATSELSELQFAADMPVNLSVKNAPDEIVDRLRERAKRNHRSLQGELMAIIEAAAEPRKLTVTEACEKLQALVLRTPSESVDMIRADRDGR